MNPTSVDDGKPFSLRKQVTYRSTGLSRFLLIYTIRLCHVLASENNMKITLI